jgi:hypothetical protein
MKNPKPIETILYFTNQRAKLSGYILEIFRYEKSIMIGNRKIKRTTGEETKKTEGEKLTPEEIRTKNMRRAKRTVIDLVNSNAWQWKKRDRTVYTPIFITFTFRENINNLDSAHYEFKKFIKRLSYENWGLNVNILKYLTVVEFQTRGAIHYHVVFFNLPFMERIYDKMCSIWGHGFTWVESVKTEKGIAKYLCKYLTKSINEGRLQTRKSYFASKGLKKPIIITIEELVNSIRVILPNELEGRCYDYEAEYLKHTEVAEYNLKYYPKVLDNIHNEIINKFL